MALRSVEVVIDGDHYTVTEQTMDVVLPLIEKGGDAALMTGLIRASVSNGTGQPLGDGVNQIGFRTYRRLIDAVNEVHGLGEEGDEGNASGA